MFDSGKEPEFSSWPLYVLTWIGKTLGSCLSIKSFSVVKWGSFERFQCFLLCIEDIKNVVFSTQRDPLKLYRKGTLVSW